jgi:multiple sugar transport system substrate-binding protein
MCLNKRGGKTMKGLNKLIVCVLVLALLISAVACSGTPAQSSAPASEGQSAAAPASSDAASSAAPASEAAVEQGKVLRIYCWNEEFKSRFTDYFEKAGKIPEGITVEWVTTPNDNNGYQNKLDQDLLNQDKASADEKIDLFLIEADYALKYVDTEYALDVYADVGLTEDDTKDMYQYTKDIATDSNGKLKAVSWQATPGLFAYRRSFAKDVLGTDDPDQVQTYLSDWTKFNEVAAKAADKGYKMLSGYDDAYRAFSNNVSGPWVDANNTIVIDPNLMNWVDQTKEFADKGYNNRYSLWDPEWNADQGPSGKVFGFFFSTWGINFTLLGNSLATPESEGGKKEVGNGIFGDYAVCYGPQSYYWGGTWLCACKGSDNLPLVRDIMYTLTCDPATMKQITLDTEDYTNNQTAMNEIANSDYQSALLGGQNHIKLFTETAPKIDMSNVSPYDQGCTEEFQDAFRDYFDGLVTKEQALDNFYNAVITKYPNLQRPAA